MQDVAADPHLRARGAVQEVGGIPMQGLVAHLSATPGSLRWPGRPLGADTAEVLAEVAGRGRDGPAEGGGTVAAGSTTTEKRTT
jgi:crotonobetainyl-CoA:carnitine CoA-transferase CaiB-like acyl-CoA transferase